MLSRRIEARVLDPLREAITDVIDRRRLFAARSEFAVTYRTGLRRVQDLLKASYRYYKTNISQGGSAVSFETACFLYLWCEAYRPRFVLDLGSGYSSFVFRLYQRDVNKDARIVSVDNSEDWLRKTGEFLVEQGLSCTDLLPASGLDRLDLNELDLAFLDIRPLDLRIDLMPRLMKELGSSGALMIDDLHKAHFRPRVRSEAERLGCKLYNVRGLTLDSYGRYAYVLTKATT